MKKIPVAIAVAMILLAFPGAVPLRAVSCNDVNGCIWAAQFAPGLELSQYGITSGAETANSFVPTAFAGATEGKGLAFVSNSAFGSNLLYYTAVDNTFAGDGLIHITDGVGNFTIAAPSSTIGALAFDASNNVLWASDWILGGAGQATIWPLNPNTGAILDLNPGVLGDVFDQFNVTTLGAAGPDGMAVIGGNLWINQDDTVGTYFEYLFSGGAATGSSFTTVSAATGVVTDFGSGIAQVTDPGSSQFGSVYLATAEDSNFEPAFAQVNTGSGLVSDVGCNTGGPTGNPPNCINTAFDFFENITFQPFTAPAAPELSGNILGMKYAGWIFSFGAGLLGLSLIRRRAASPRG